MRRKSSDTPRLPFDPSRVKGVGQVPEAAPESSEDGGMGSKAISKSTDPPISVSQLTRQIKGAIQGALPGDVRVLGELSNVSRPAGGHIYFTMKDATSEVRCVMWRSSAQSLKFDMQEGLEAVATGTVDVYEPRGQYQLYVRRLMPCGVGALDLAFQQLREKLAREGLFDPDRKRSIPKHPRTIAIVTSPTGAAIRDMLQTLERRYPKVRILVFGVRVQGDGAAAEIADAIRRINLSSHALGGVDVMIVGRGGGSLEDLWAFNEEPVARAIFASQIPIVSAVGHEVDFTIADFVADVRAATPTAAAELVAPLLIDVVGELSALQHRLSHAIRRRHESASLRLAAIERSAWFRDPVGQIGRIYQRVDEIAGRLRYSIARRLHRSKTLLHRMEVRFISVRPTVQLSRRRERIARLEHRLERGLEAALHHWERRIRGVELRLATASPGHRIDSERQRLERAAIDLRGAILRHLSLRGSQLSSIEARLNAASHESVLNRGFSITRRSQDGRVVRSPEDVAKGDKLTTLTADGEISSRVMDDRQGELFE